MSDSRRRTNRASGFKSMKQVGVAVSIGFPLLVIGVLTLVVFLISWVGTATALWIIAAVVLALGIIGSLSGRVV